MSIRCILGFHQWSDWKPLEGIYYFRWCTRCEDAEWQVFR